MSKFDKPAKVSVADVAFGGSMADLLPPMSSIPDEFKRHQGTKFNKVVSAWFFRGLPAETKFIVKDGIDHSDAMRHIKAILGSWEPKHEHKEAGVAYLMSLWFSDVVIPESVGA